jgi:hypothetical protein
MAYLPTVADFRTRYPEFGDLSASRIQAVLTEVAAEVGDAWIPATQKPAALALAAHLLAETGALSTADGMVSSVAPGSVIEQHAGDTGQKFSSTTSASSGSSSANVVSALSRTAYGLRYLELRNRSFPSVGIC